MQEDGPGGAMIVVPTVKARATDFSIAAIMARGPRAERRTTCGATTAAAGVQHTVCLPTLGKSAAFCPSCSHSESEKQVTGSAELARVSFFLRHGSVLIGYGSLSRQKYVGLWRFGGCWPFSLQYIS